MAFFPPRLRRKESKLRQLAEEIRLRGKELENQEAALQTKVPQCRPCALRGTVGPTECFSPPGGRSEEEEEETGGGRGGSRRTDGGETRADRENAACWRRCLENPEWKCKDLRLGGRRPQAASDLSEIS